MCGKSLKDVVSLWGEFEGRGESVGSLKDVVSLWEEFEGRGESVGSLKDVVSLWEEFEGRGEADCFFYRKSLEVVVSLGKVLSGLLLKI